MPSNNFWISTSRKQPDLLICVKDFANHLLLTRKSFQKKWLKKKKAEYLRQRLKECFCEDHEDISKYLDICFIMTKSLETGKDTEPLRELGFS